MTHHELCIRAASWLKNSLHCRCVIVEPGTASAGGEIPDVIGWNNSRSILVECKTSRADFRADLDKHFRRSAYHIAKAVGHWRFYFAEQGIIPHDKLPEGWGLYEVVGRQVKHAAGPKHANAFQGPFPSNRDYEVALLLYHADKLKMEIKQQKE